MAYQIQPPLKKLTASHQKRAVRIASGTVQSIATHAASTTFDRRFATVPAAVRCSPSGSRPRLSGLLATSRLIGSSTTRVISPSFQHAARQPSCRISTCSQGRIRIAPAPTPEKAMPMASARRRTNQLGRNWECTE